MERAVIAEWILGQVRANPNAPVVDILMGIPEEEVIAERQAAMNAARKAQALRKYGDRHRKPGDKNDFVDPEQLQMFEEERERAQVETMFNTSDFDIPPGMIKDIDMGLPVEFLKHAEVNKNPNSR